MADGVTLSAEEPPKKKGFLKKLLLPLVLLVVGIGAGAAGAWFLPSYVSGMAKPKPPEPVVGPLEYVEIENSFTANLKDTGRFIQVKIAVSTHAGPPVVEAVDRHRLAIIAAVLGVLADTTEEDIAAVGGRDRLTKAMRVAINDILQRKSGLAGVDDVYLTSFVLQ